jgi:cytochrome b561
VCLTALCTLGGVARAETLSAAGLMLERASVSDLALLTEADSAAADPDTASNKALDDMLMQFKTREQSTELAYDSWTLPVHRFLGYAILVGAAAQIVLGAMTYDEEEDGGPVPDTVDAHKYLGYTMVGLSIVQTGLGFYNFWQMKDRETGKTKRWVHLTLSTLATAGFITAAAIAANSREEIDSGQASAEGKTFQDLYDTHRTVGILSAASVFLTAIVIVW